MILMSGRPKKIDLSKLAQEILNGTFSDVKGRQMTGAELLKHGLVANISNPNSKNWAKSVELMLQLTGGNLTPEQKKKMKAEAELAAMKVKAYKAKIAEEDDTDEL